MRRVRSFGIALLCLPECIALCLGVLLSAGACSDDAAPRGGTRKVSVPDGGGSGAASDAAMDADRSPPEPTADASTHKDAADVADAELGPRCSHPAVSASEPSPCGEPIAPSTCRFETHAIDAVGAAELRALDFDADGRLDLAALSSAAGFGAVRLSGPSGAPDGCTQDLGLDPLPTDPLEPASVSAGDLDADGDLDLVRLSCAQPACERFDLLELYHNDGRGRLERGEDFGYEPLDAARESELRAPIAVDLDGDERSEVVVQAVEPGGDVTLLVLEHGDARLQEQVRLQADVRGSLPHALDVDADGDLDVAWIAHDQSSPASEPLRIDVTVNEDGVFDRIASTTYPDLYASTPRVVVVDLDDDGRPDLALQVGATRSVELPKELVILRSEADARFERATRLPLAVTDLAYAGRDPACDGHVLVGLGARSLDFIAVGASLALSALGSVSVSESMSELVAGDFDGDGRNELAAATEDGVVVRVPTECTR